MIYTGGTTGRPKGALRTATDPTVARRYMELFGLAEPHVHLVAGPLYHSAPGSFAQFTHAFGGTVVVMRKFDPEDALRTIERHRCTSTFMAPTLVKRIVDLPERVRARYDVRSMRVLVIAAAPCPTRVKEQAVADFGPALWEFYGSTELGINTILPPADVLRKPGSCGRAAPGIELVLLDDAGRPVPTGTAGELYVRRFPGMFDGYYKDSAATREAQRGEWASVGDVAWMDDEGFVYICDRKRDMVISGGVNIYPAEIEDVLHRHPAIDDVAVFGVPDDDWGERVHAAVQPRPGQALAADEVVAFARLHMADYKVPRECAHIDASGSSWLTPPPPWSCMARSITPSVMLGTATLISAIAWRAALLPTVSIMCAAWSTSRRAWSISIRDCAMRSSVMSLSASGLPKATRFIARLHISSSARSATPIWRMQWWMRPGPRRPCAISKPRPSPSSMLDAGTRTFSKRTSPWPCGASSYPNTVSIRITLRPGVSRGTRIIDCCLYLSGFFASVFPMKMRIAQRGSPMPEVHHLCPLIT